MEEQKSPLDGGTEMPAPAEEQSALVPEKKRMPLKAKVAVVVGCALMIAGIGCGLALSMQKPAETAQQPAVELQAQKHEAKIKVDLRDWDAQGATALIAHITGDGVDFYTALDSKGEATLELDEGEYQIEFVPSIGADGSLLQVKSKSTLKVSGGDASVSAKAEAKAAADVSKEEISAAIDQISAAVKKGDSSLKGDAGKKLLESAKANASANPNMDEEAKAEAESKADDAEKAADEAPAQVAQGSGESTGSNGSGAASSASKPAASASGSGSSSASGSSNSGGSSAPAPSDPSQPAHTHNWVAVTEQRWHSNPVSVWVQDSAAWDEAQPIYEWVDWCTKCNCQVSYTHTKDMMLQGIGGHSLTEKHVQTGTTTVHHDATGHYETKDQGWYETVTTGYQCSGCGAWQ